MGILKSFFAFIIGLIALIICYNYIHIPAVVGICIYIPSFLFASNNYSPKARIIFVVILSIIGIYLYSFNIYTSIKYYPQYLTILGIIFEFINVFSIISAGAFHIFLHATESSYKKQ